MLCTALNRWKSGDISSYPHVHSPVLAVHSSTLGNVLFVFIAQVAAQLNTLRRCRKYFLLRALKFADSKNISNGSYKLWWDLHFVSCTISCTIVIFSDFSNTRFDIINDLFSFWGHVNKCFPSTFFFQYTVLQFKFYRVNFRSFGDERCEQTDRHVWVHLCKGIFLAYIQNVICDTPFRCDVPVVFYRLNTIFI